MPSSVVRLDGWSGEKSIDSTTILILEEIQSAISGKGSS